MVWDPAGDYNEGAIQAAMSGLSSKIEALRNDPERPRRALRKTILISTLAVITIGAVGFFFSVPQIIFYPLIPAFLVYLIVYGMYRDLSRDYMKHEIAKAHGWAFYPGNQPGRAARFMKEFPELFRKGDGQFIEDQYWSTDDSHPFNAGIFHYYTEHRDSKGRKTRRDHYYHYFAFRIPTKGERFLLYPEGAFSKIGNLFTGKEINTESIEFNKAFAFSYEGKKEERGLAIMKALSPAVQAKLLELRKEHGEMSVLFTPQSVFFLFKGKMIGKHKTNLLKGLKVSQEDIDALSGRIIGLRKIAKEMVRYLD